MPRVLFLPSYFGGGFGHIGRCLALAAELEKRGWETAFALSGPHRRRLEEDGREVYRLRMPYEPRPEKMESGGSVFTKLGGMDYQLVRDGLVTGNVVRAAIAEQLGVSMRFQADLLVGDAAPLAGLVANRSGLPLAQITRSILHPEGPGLIWWQDMPKELVPPDLQPVFNPILLSWGLPAMRRAEDLLWGDLHLVPSIPELDPLPDGLPHVSYTGPLVRPPREEAPAWLDALDPARPLVYMTAGGGAAGVGGRDFYLALFEALGSCEVQVVASTGSGLDSRSLPAPPDNMRLEAWVPGPAVIARSSLVVCTGGYGTTMECVQAGVPALVIPFHTEQESNARRLEAAGAARLLMPGEGEPEVVWHAYPGGGLTTLELRQGALRADRLRQAILGALEDPSLRQGARRLQAVAAPYAGPPAAADLLEEMLARRPPDGRPRPPRRGLLERLGLRRPG